MLAAEFEAATPANEQPQNHTSDSAATYISAQIFLLEENKLYRMSTIYRSTVNRKVVKLTLYTPRRQWEGGREWRQL
jgi:hypothetical protein